MIVAIHQPNFFPWLGYFNKIARCDVFLVLDDVQYQKTGSSWSNRVKMLVGGQARWVTAPVRRPAHGTARIDELSWVIEPWRDRLVRTLAANYAGAPFFHQAMDLVRPLIGEPEPSVARYNLKVIRGLCDALGLPLRRVSSSQFRLTSASNERLVELCRHVGCDTYLAGGGAQDYQQDDVFQAAGIRVLYQSFQHPVYRQHGSDEFVAGLSIVDALMNCGIEGTRALVRSAPTGADAPHPLKSSSDEFH